MGAAPVRGGRPQVPGSQTVECCGPVMGLNATNGRPPGADAEQTSNIARGTPWKRRTCGYSDFDRPRCREVSGSVGPSGPWRPARPRFFSRAAAKMNDGLPGAGKECGRRSVGCLKIESVERRDG